ncbi:hypothetical protein LMJ38_24235 [Streptomyces sp. R1]|uniref:hypothetical protein n=1 Tax=Streptomyces sp. R1 TaxID=1509279 RepID=UPI001E61BAAC|nr:hypothetical protein [Streptomyces sp. R1]MCC8339029.1 hypothetical protein [Streptomyces sp. R1]
MALSTAPRYVVFTHAPCVTPLSDSLVNTSVVTLEDLRRNRAVRSRELLHRLAVRHDGREFPLVSSGMLSARLRESGALTEATARACQEGLAAALTEVSVGHMEATSFHLGTLALRLISHDTGVRLRLYHAESGRWMTYGPQDQGAVLRSIRGHLNRRAAAAHHSSHPQQTDAFTVTSPKGYSYVTHA